MTDIPWLWCLGSFIVGMTTGMALLIFVVLAGTPLRPHARDDD